MVFDLISDVSRWLLASVQASVQRAETVGDFRSNVSGFGPAAHGHHAGFPFDPQGLVVECHRLTACGFQLDALDCRDAAWDVNPQVNQLGFRWQLGLDCLPIVRIL